MSWFRSADASLVWAREVPRIYLIVFGCAGKLTLGPSRLIPRAGQAATCDPATANDFLRL
jgi:hypothetical protein